VDPNRSTTTQKVQRLVPARCFVATANKHSETYVETKSTSYASCLPAIPRISVVCYENGPMRSISVSEYGSGPAFRIEEYSSITRILC